MKKVTIPNTMNPFVVMLNGVKHEFEAGATVEVEDALAELISGSKFEPPLAPVVPSGGGGVSSWNDLEDKPFGSETTETHIASYGADGGIQWAESGGVYVAQNVFDITLEEGKTYTVDQYPGYTYIAKTGQGMACIGNLSLLGFGEDTGEPFVVVDMGGKAAIAAKQPTEMFFVNEVEITEKITPLAEKYLPASVPAVLVRRVNGNGLIDTTYEELFEKVIDGDISGNVPAILLGSGTLMGWQFTNLDSDVNTATGVETILAYGFKMYNGKIQVQQLTINTDNTVSNTVYTITPDT